MKEKKSLPLWLRRTLIIGGSILGTAGLITGILIGIRSNSAPVNVYSVNDVRVSYQGLGQAETNGNVTADRIQSVYVSSTQIVQEVYVKEGDTVKVGDPLIHFDTTLSDIELKRQEIKVGQLELELKQAEQELKRVNTYRVGSPVTPPSVVKDPFTLNYYGYRARGSYGDEYGNATEAMESGCGTELDPYVVVWNEACILTPDFAARVFNQGVYTAPGEDAPDGAMGTYEPAESVYVMLEERDCDSMDGYVVQNYMVKIMAGPSYNIIFDAPEGYDPCNPQRDIPVDNTVYVSSADELAELKKDAQEKVDNLTLDLKKANYDYSVLEYEVTNGLVVSKIDGVVKSIADAEDVSGTNDPVLVVSGGGGYFVSGVLSETELPYMHVGDSVNVMSWQSYQNYEAVITEISEYPVDNKDNQYYHYSEGNGNASLYRFTAAIEDGASVREGENLNITYTPTSEGTRGIFLPNMFIRNDNGVSYVYIENEQGLLERRDISTGGSLWGSYTEILSGLTEDDHVAFPYGKNLKEGAKVKECSTDVLYSY